MALVDDEVTSSSGAGSPDVELGLQGQTILQCAHVAYFWETAKDFSAAMGFLEIGLRKNDYCVIFGHDDANAAVCRLLDEKGLDVGALRAQHRIVVLGGNPSGEQIVQNIGAAFAAAVQRGAGLIRLLGNIGWGKQNWPADHELFAFEAKVTDAAHKFPCVVLCMYDMVSLPGHIIHHAGFGTHPYLIFGPGSLRDNPYYVPTEMFTERIETLAREIMIRKRGTDALRRSEDQFRSLFENSIDAVLLSSPEGVIEAANPEACRLFGRTEEEIRQIGRAGLVDTRDPRLPAFLKERARAGRARGELTLMHGDGSTFLGEVSSAFYEDKSGATKASVIIRDITERKRLEETLRDIIEGTAAKTGDEFFRSLVLHLAHAIEIRYCFIAECSDETKKRVRTLALWAGESFGENVEYPLQGTPCEQVIQGEACVYPEALRTLFPKDKELSALGVESYVGLPVTNSSGEVLGHLVAMDDKPKRFGDNAISLLRIFAIRAGAEIERKRADEALRQSEKRVRTLLDINNAIVSKLTRDELFRAICAAVSRVIPYDRIALSLFDPALGAVKLIAYEGPLRTDNSPVGNVHDLKDSHVGWVFMHQRPLLRHDLGVERQFSSEHRAFDNGFRSLCALPLVVRGQSMGAITVASLTNQQYDQKDAEFLMEVAKQIAIAVDILKAHEEMEALKVRFEAEAIYLQEEIKTEHNFEEIIGQSMPVQLLLRNIEQVAPTEATVLIQGETGTGKELLARAIHDRSTRKERPLVKVNCGAIPAGLVESELFGHEKGAFTGATQRRVGRFELAHGGTIFLDEVTELPVDTQVKLLRVLQEGEFERVGSSQTIKVDVRVIAATNRPINDAVKSGILRTDLFYRLNVFPLEVPPLRTRREDIPLLVNFFLSKSAKKLGKEIRGVSQGSMERLKSYSWPGNVRELQNIIERAVVLSRSPVVHVDESVVEAKSEARDTSVDTLENIERLHILRALHETQWVVHGKKGAAEILGINPSTLRSRMEKLGIKRPQLS